MPGYKIILVSEKQHLFVYTFLLLRFLVVSIKQHGNAGYCTNSYLGFNKSYSNGIKQSYVIVLQSILRSKYNTASIRLACWSSG